LLGISKKWGCGKNVRFRAEGKHIEEAINLNPSGPKKFPNVNRLSPAIWLSGCFPSPLTPQGSRLKASASPLKPPLDLSSAISYTFGP